MIIMRICGCLALLTALETSMKENGRVSLAKYQLWVLCESLCTRTPRSTEMLPQGSSLPRRSRSWRISHQLPDLQVVNPWRHSLHFIRRFWWNQALLPHQWPLYFTLQLASPSFSVLLSFCLTPVAQWTLPKQAPGTSPCPRPCTRENRNSDTGGLRWVPSSDKLVGCCPCTCWPGLAPKLLSCMSSRCRSGVQFARRSSSSPGTFFNLLQLIF